MIQECCNLRYQSLSKPAECFDKGELNAGGGRLVAVEQIFSGNANCQTRTVFIACDIVQALVSAAQSRCPSTG